MTALQITGCLWLMLYYSIRFVVRAVSLINLQHEYCEFRFN